MNAPTNLQNLDPKPRRAAAFTLTDLLVVVGVLGLLILLAVPALGNARANSRQLSCLNNLRQLGIASSLYVVEYRRYPGCLWPAAQGFYYVWPERLFGFTSRDRKVFSCPGANPRSAWDPSLNTTLGMVAPYDTSHGVKSGMFDPWAVSSTSRFSYGYNDWGLGPVLSGKAYGLGGDVNSEAYYVWESDVVAPSQLIMIADTPAPQSGWNWSANLDVTSDAPPHSERPSNRHQYRTDIVFADGHTESPKRSDVINPTPNHPWRSRWNNDNKPHNELSWIVTPAYNDPLEPSY